MRQFLTTLSLAGAARLVAAPAALAEEGPLETTTVRLPKAEGVCGAPPYMSSPICYGPRASRISASCRKRRALRRPI